MDITLLEIIELTGQIEVLTGLHIGAGSEEIHIGGIDSPVVRDPVSGFPYIPGSSIKGKIRSLLELRTGRAGDGTPWSTEDDSDPIARIFGNGKVLDGFKGGPTRVSFNDCKIKNPDELINKDALTEEKTEVAINRLSGTAISPRHIERVPAGAKFDFSVSYKVMDVNGDKGDTDRENLELLRIGMKLLEQDSLGGSGSRGYGRVTFTLDEGSLDDVDMEDIEKFILTRE